MLERAHDLSQVWSYNLVDSKFDFPKNDLRFRESRSGPEEDMISSFLSKLDSRSNPGTQLTIFKEPWLESGSPDLVGVIWDLPTAETWNQNRSRLNRSDFRLLHWLSETSDLNLDQIREAFGRSGWESIHRLEEADVVSTEKGSVKMRPLSTVYAVKHIFAIEAKVSAWRKAVNQAFLNRWFATSSHVLLPRLPTNREAINTARRMGVSLWAPSVTKLTLRLPATSSAPTSYVSWLFNEWTWKAWTLSSQYVNKTTNLDYTSIS